MLALVALLSDLKMDTHVLMNLLRQLVEPFRKLLLLAFEGECRRIVQAETYQPLEVQVIPYQYALIEVFVEKGGALWEGRGGGYFFYFLNACLLVKRSV